MLASITHTITKLNKELEFWKYINGTNDDYKISSHGRVKSFKRKKPKLMSVYHDNKNSNGYMRVSVRTQNSDEKIHRLLALHYIDNPNPEEYNMIDHIDGDKTNNSLENLRWCNASINLTNRKTSGTIFKTKYGTYCVQYTYKPTKRTSKTFKTLKEAEEFKAKISRNYGEY